MSYSKTKIFNIALSNLGVSAPIQNSLEDNPTAILLNNYYEMARDTVLEEHEWSFATAYKNLSEAFDNPPQSNWMYSFNYPNDCIAPRAVTDTVENKEKKFETATKENGEKIILTNCNPCILRYTRRVTNETFFSAAFVNALGFYLAYLGAMVVVGSANKKNTNLQDYRLAIRSAIVTDARKNVVHDEDDTDYTDYR